MIFVFNRTPRVPWLMFCNELQVVNDRNGVRWRPDVSQSYGENAQSKLCKTICIYACRNKQYLSDREHTSTVQFTLHTCIDIIIIVTDLKIDY